MIKGFITNLGKYNEGYLIGEWVSFPATEEELEEVYSRIGINEVYEEFFFTAWESEVYGVADYFGEYASIDDINEVAEALESLDKWDIKTFEAVAEVWGIDTAIESLDNNSLDEYNFIVADSDYDLGYYWIEESGCFCETIPESIGYYIDYEAYGRDFRLESDGGFASEGYIYR